MYGGLGGPFAPGFAALIELALTYGTVLRNTQTMFQTLSHQKAPQATHAAPAFSTEVCMACRPFAPFWGDCCQRPENAKNGLVGVLRCAQAALTLWFRVSRSSPAPNSTPGAWPSPPARPPTRLTSPSRSPSRECYPVSPPVCTVDHEDYCPAPSNRRVGMGVSSTLRLLEHL